MGKVASSSIYESIKATGNVNVFHLHRLNPENIKQVKQEHLLRGASPPDEKLGHYLYKNLILSNRDQIKIISLVREPIGRNISAYFQNLKSFEFIKNAHQTIEIDQMIEKFLRNYSHNVPLTWFDNELHATVGIDVYKNIFLQKQGYQIIHEPPYNLLIMRHDLYDPLKENLIRDFLNLKSFHLLRTNVSSSKEYAEKYKEFITSIKIPVEYSERMLSSKYASHFFSDEELFDIHRKWTGVQQT